MSLDIAAVDAVIIAEFGESITYTPDGGSSTSITGFFQNPDVEVDSTEALLQSNAPTLSVLTSEVPSPSYDDEFVVRTIPFRVSEIMIDEGSYKVLRLVQASTPYTENFAAADEDVAAIDSAIVTEFGETVTYTPDGGSPVSITAFKQNPDIEVEANDVPIVGNALILMVLNTDVTDPQYDDEFQVDSVDYRVAEVLQDEGAVTMLRLIKKGTPPSGVVYIETYTGDHIITAVTGDKITVA